MSGPCCDNCVYSVFDPELWRRLMWMGEPIFPRCANHPDHPGQLREVPGVACCHYRRKPILPQGESVRMIPLGDGFYAYIDAKNYDWLSQWSWSVVSAGYAARHEKGKYVFMHREIMKPPKGMIVDHIDGNKANNCEFNLRVCSRRQNQRNLRKQHRACTQFKGVFYDKRRQKWYARCESRTERHFLSYFDDEVEAAKAYDQAAVERFGEFARVNFPREWPPERRAQVHAEWQEAEGKRRREKGKSKKEKGKSKKARSKGPAHKRKMHDAPRKTKSERATGHESRATKKTSARAGAQGRREGKRRRNVEKAKRRKADPPPAPE